MIINKYTLHEICEIKVVWKPKSYYFIQYNTDIENLYDNDDKKELPKILKEYVPNCGCNRRTINTYKFLVLGEYNGNLRDYNFQLYLSKMKTTMHIANIRMFITHPYDTDILYFVFDFSNKLNLLTNYKYSCIDNSNCRCSTYEILTDLYENKFSPEWAPKLYNPKTGDFYQKNDNCDDDDCITFLKYIDFLNYLKKTDFLKESSESENNSSEVESE